MKLSILIKLLITFCLWAVFFIMLPGAMAQPAQTPPPYMPCSGINKVDQKFPVAGPEETHWLICWEAVPKKGLVIHWAFFRTPPTAKWVQIFWDARVSEMFVPYHDNSHRFYDMSGHSFVLQPVVSAASPALLCSTPLGVAVCTDVRYRD